MTATDIHRSYSDIRVNVGCGASPTPGWLNFDNSLSVRIAGHPGISAVLSAAHLINAQSASLMRMAQTGTVRFANAAARIPCASGSVSALYSSHMIEHLDRAGARAFLAEAKRVLRPGGVLRLAAPDLARLVRGYVASGDADDFVARSHMGLDRSDGLRALAPGALAGPRPRLWVDARRSLVEIVRAVAHTSELHRPPYTPNPTRTI